MSRLVTVQVPAGGRRIGLAFLLWLLLIPILRLVVRLVVLETRWPGGRRPSSDPPAARYAEGR